MPTSPASGDRRAAIDRALADSRAGRDRNRRAAGIQLEPSHGNPPRSADTPNTGPGRDGRR